MASASSSLPLHVALAEKLAREIQAGLYPDGTRLPPEREMAADLGVAVGTLRRGLSDLEAKGLLERRQGSGNYVRNAAGAQTLYSFFRLERILGGGLPTARVLDVATVPKPGRMAAIGPSTKGLRIRRLRLLDGIPSAIEEIWLDADRAGHVTSDDLPDSLYRFYRESLGLLIASVSDVVACAPPPSWLPKDFVVPAPVWGHVERTGFDQSDTAVEVSRTWFDPSCTRYVNRSK